MSFVLFIALNAFMLIRPEELSPDIAGLRPYYILILLTSLLALPKILIQLSPQVLPRRPITVCVLGILAVSAFSLLVHGKFDKAEDFVPEFAKVIDYYLLLTALVDTPSRMKTFLAWLVVFLMVVAGLGLLQYLGSIDLPALRPLLQKDTEFSEEFEFARLRSTGIFNDPNDLCLILVFGIMACLYQAATSINRMLAAIWMLPIGLFGYAIFCTSSRGGLLGLIAAVGALVYYRFGWKITALGGLICAGALMAAGARQSELASESGHERVMLWASGISDLINRPVFLLTGVGADTYADEFGQVAHNTFIHAYFELGLLGGAFFLTAFLCAVAMLFRADTAAMFKRSRDLAVGRPIMMAMVVGYAVGSFSLSRNYVTPTFLCLGVASSFIAMAMPDPPSYFRVNQKWFLRLVLIGIGGFAFLKVFTQAAGMLGA